MKIYVLNLGDVQECLVSSSLNRGLLRKYGRHDLTWVVKGEEEKSLFQYTQGLRVLLAHEFLNNLMDEADIVVNLTPAIHPADPALKFKKFVGFNSEDEDASDYHEFIHGSRKTNMNVLQVYFRLAGMTWRGEGYGITYYPKTRTRKNSVAIVIDHSKLRHYVNDNLSADAFKLVLVPYKRNVFKRLDEINRCVHVITDDLLTMHLSVMLKKKVHFLETIPLNTKLEFFGNGEIYKVPTKIVT